MAQLQRKAQGPRVHLPLRDKIKVLQFLSRDMSLQQAADKFKISRAQVQWIAKARSQLERDFETEALWRQEEHGRRDIQSLTTLFPTSLRFYARSACQYSLSVI